MSSPDAGKNELGLVVSASAFGIWLWYAWAQSGRTHRRPLHEEEAWSPPLLPSCPDYNRSCWMPCERCHQLAQQDCARCATHKALRCPSARSNASVPLSHRQAIRWLHIPKCGSTIALSVLSHACKEVIPAWHMVGMALQGGRLDVRVAHALRARYRMRGRRCNGKLLLPFDSHRPVMQGETQLVALFRRPAQRLISAFLDNRHAWGLDAAERAGLRRATPTIATFVRYPGIAGCATKMLAGHRCAERVALDDGRVLRSALNVLRSGRFAFIGLVERWTESICLMHRVLLGSPVPMMAEFLQLGHSKNSRLEISWLPRSNANGWYNESVLEGFVDEADESVYAEAAAIFQRQFDAQGWQHEIAAHMSVRDGSAEPR